jgi:hypothetical protein
VKKIDAMPLTIVSSEATRARARWGSVKPVTRKPTALKT